MTDTYYTDAQGRNKIDKDPGGKLDYPYKWTEWLDAVSDTIFTATITADPGITIESYMILPGNKIVTVWVSGGTVGQTYKVTCHIVTAGGREDERTIYVVVKQK